MFVSCRLFKGFYNEPRNPFIVYDQCFSSRLLLTRGLNSHSYFDRSELKDPTVKDKCQKGKLAGKC